MFEHERGDADTLRDVVRAHTLKTLFYPDAVLMPDETDFLKQRKVLCGVHREYTGSAGKITNCEIGVFAAYASQHGHAFLNGTLSLLASPTCALATPHDGPNSS